MPLEQSDAKVYPDPEVVGDAIEVRQSTCANSTIEIQIIDVGGNSRGTFEFDRTAQVCQIKEELALPDEQRANLVFLDTILDDNLTLEHAKIPTGATITVVITTKLLSERVMAILNARQTSTPEGEARNSDVSRFHDALYCFVVLPVLNDAFYVSGMWMHVLNWKLSHLLLMIDTFISICGMALLKHLAELNHDAPRCDCLCGCSCAAYTILALGTWHLLCLLFAFYHVSIDIFPFNTEEMIEKEQYRISVVVVFALSSITVLAFGSYWRKMNSRHFKKPNSGTSVAVGHFV